MQQGVRSLSWTGAGVPIPCEEKAADVFARMFLQGTKAEGEARGRKLETGRSILAPLRKRSERPPRFRCTELACQSGAAVLQSSTRCLLKFEMHAGKRSILVITPGGRALGNWRLSAMGSLGIKIDRSCWR
ncbi:MAG TPA: DUF1552 domain-containing protein [Verrucomicrobiae bacterium]|nr:DUF1552 domain-containing protein [Verrucomicrobiae bacterium]